MISLCKKLISVGISVTLLTGAFTVFAATKVKAQTGDDSVSYFNLQRALTNPAAAQGAKNLKYCLYGNIDKALREGMRSKSAIAAKVAPVCYQQLAVPLRQQHLVYGMTDAQIERVVENVAYDVIDDVVKAETEQ